MQPAGTGKERPIRWQSGADIKCFKDAEAAKDVLTKAQKGVKRTVALDEAEYQGRKSSIQKLTPMSPCVFDKLEIQSDRNKALRRQRDANRREKKAEEKRQRGHRDLSVEMLEMYSPIGVDETYKTAQSSVFFANFVLAKDQQERDTSLGIIKFTAGKIDPRALLVSNWYSPRFKRSCHHGFLAFGVYDISKIWNLNEAGVRDVPKFDPQSTDLRKLKRAELKCGIAQSILLSAAFAAARVFSHSKQENISVFWWEYSWQSLSEWSPLQIDVFSQVYCQLPEIMAVCLEKGEERIEKMKAIELVFKVSVIRLADDKWNFAPNAIKDNYVQNSTDSF